MNSQLKFLIVRLSALGDAALTLPLYCTLRENFPHAYIGWVIEEKCAGLLSAITGIDRVHLWRTSDKNWRGALKLAREIRAENYDVAFDAQGLTKSAVLPFLARIKRRIGFKRAPLEAREFSPLLNNELVSPPAEITQIALRSQYLAQPLNVKKFSAITDTQKFIITPKLSSKNEKPILLLGIGTSWETKILPMEYMRVLLAHALAHNFQPVITWGALEEKKIPQWQKILGELNDKIIWAERTNTVSELIALLNTATAYAGPDSAPLHLSWLLGKPTFSWFGPSCAKRGAPIGEQQQHLVAYPPTRQRYGDGLVTLTPEIILPHFADWLNKIP